jgi:hypothetical protein
MMMWNVRILDGIKWDYFWDQSVIKWDSYWDSLEVEIWDQARDSFWDSLEVEIWDQASTIGK